MLVTRWFVIILFILCVALLLDFCSCATVTKETALNMKNVFDEDFDNDFEKGASTEATQNLSEVDNDYEEDDEHLSEDEQGEDRRDNEIQDTVDIDDVYKEEKSGPKSENKDESIYEDDDDLDEEDDFGEGDEIIYIDQEADEDAEEEGDDFSDETAMEQANELEILPRDEKKESDALYQHEIEEHQRKRRRRGQRLRVLIDTINVRRSGRGGRERRTRKRLPGGAGPDSMGRCRRRRPPGLLC